MLTRRLIAPLTVLAFAALTSSASAAEPCPPEDDPYTKLTYTAKVAYGRVGVAGIDGKGNSDNARLSFIPANSGDSLQGAFVDSPPRALTAYDPNDKKNDDFPLDAAWRLPVAAGDGPAIVRATWEDTSGSRACARAAEGLITPVRGALPKVWVNTEYGEMIGLGIGGDLPCREMRTGAVTVRVRGAGQTRKYTLEDVCGEWRGHRAPRSFKVERLGGNGALLELRPKKRSEDSQKIYRVDVRMAGKRLSRLRFRVRWIYERGYRIWEGSDEFVNYCINDEDARIWSSGGRLYCDYPTHRWVDVKRL